MSFQPRPEPRGHPTTFTITSPCPRCQHVRVVERLCTGGPHHSVRACEKCGLVRGYGRHPSTPEPPVPDELLERASLRTGGFAELEGSEKQIAWARSIRARMHSTALARDDHNRAAILASVRDATFFIANASKSYEEMKFPSLTQLEED